MNSIREESRKYHKAANRGLIDAVRKMPKMKSNGILGDLRDLGRDFAKGLRKGFRGGR